MCSDVQTLSLSPLAFPAPSFRHSARPLHYDGGEVPLEDCPQVS